MLSKRKTGKNPTVKIFFIGLDYVFPVQIIEEICDKGLFLCGGCSIGDRIDKIFNRRKKGVTESI
jgi:hypothetical protein